MCLVGCSLRHRYLFLRKCLVFVVYHLSFLANNRKDCRNQLHAFTFPTSFAKSSTFHLRIHGLRHIFLLYRVVNSKGLFESVANSKCVV